MSAIISTSLEETCPKAPKVKYPKDIKEMVKNIHFGSY
jgi:hypothetical protein